MRTCVRAASALLHPLRARRGRCLGAHVHGSAPRARATAWRRQPRHAPQVLPSVGHLDDALRSGRRHARARRATPRIGHSARRDHGRAQHVQSRAPQAPPPRRGGKGAVLRVLRPGRALARGHDGAHPRPRQRRGRRSPAREPADPLPQLRRDPRHALRAEEPHRARSGSVRPMRRAVRPSLRRAALLLALLRLALDSARRQPRSPPPRRAAAVRASARGGPVAGVPRRGAQATASATTRSGSGSGATSASSPSSQAPPVRRGRTSAIHRGRRAAHEPPGPTPRWRGTGPPLRLRSSRPAR